MSKKHKNDTDFDGFQDLDLLAEDASLSPQDAQVTKVGPLPEEVRIQLSLDSLEAFDDDLDPDIDLSHQTVEVLNQNAFSDETTHPARDQVQSRANQEQRQSGIEQTDKSEFFDDRTVVNRKSPLSTQPEQQGLEYYRDLVEQDISFSQSTGYDREGTVVVPLAELAQSEEKRLRQQEQSDPKMEKIPENSTIPVGQIVDVLKAARSVEELAGILVEMVANIIPRVLLLWEKNAKLYGFASRGMDLEEVKLLTLEVPCEVMKSMSHSTLDSSYFGQPHVEGLVERFFDILGVRPRQVLMIPAEVTSDDRWLLYADNGVYPIADFELRLLEIIVARAGALADWLLDSDEF